MYTAGFITILFASLIFHLSLSASIPSKKSKGSKKDSYVFNKPGISVCPGGKPTDVILFIDISNYLTKDQFGVQIQRAEHMVRLFRNFNTQNKHCHRIKIYTFSGNRVEEIVKFKKCNRIGPNYTEELASTLRKLRKNHEYDNTETSRKRQEILPLKTLLKTSRNLRRGVAHVAFYFSADNSVSSFDLKRASRIKKKGIYLYILRLSSSRITFDQYKAMVSSPVSNFVFDVNQHSYIDTSVKKLLNMEHCNMQVFPGIAGVRAICEARRTVNLYLGIEQSSLQISNTNSIMKFYQKLKKELRSSNGDKIQSQLIFSDFSEDKENVSDRYISILRDTLEAVNKSLNKDSQNTLLLFFESTTTLTPEIMDEVSLLKNNKIEVYAIVEGKSKTDFSSIVSKPAKDHLFNVPYFKKLSGHKVTILKSICKGW